MFAPWLVTSALADECDPNEPIRRALAARMRGDVAATRAALDEALAAFGCGPPVDPTTLARFWLLDGASIPDDPQATLDDFAGARRVAPELWLSDLGPELRARWDAAPTATGTGSLLVSPDPGARAVWIDGARGAARQDVPAGLHLVQVGDEQGDRARFAAMVWVDAGVAAEVDSGLATIAPPPEPEPEPEHEVVPEPVAPDPKPAPAPRPPRDGGAVAPALHLLTGVGVALGEPLRSRELREPATKVAVPTELGVGFTTPAALVRVDLGAGWLLGGQWLAGSADGRIAMAAHLDAGLTAAVAVGPTWIGVSGGAAWPSRLGGRAVLAAEPAGPLWTELRLGANAPTERPIEPAGELVVGVAFGG